MINKIYEENKAKAEARSHLLGTVPQPPPLTHSPTTNPKLNFIKDLDLDKLASFTGGNLAKGTKPCKNVAIEVHYDFKPFDEV